MFSSSTHATAALLLSRRYVEELYVGMQMSESAGPDIKTILILSAPESKVKVSVHV